MTYYESTKFKNKHLTYIIITISLVVIVLFMEYVLGIDVKELLENI